MIVYQDADFALDTDPYVVATVATASAVTLQIPADMLAPDAFSERPFCYFHNRSTEVVSIRFEGDGTITLAASAVSVVASDLPAPAVNAPQLVLEPGERVRLRIPAGATHFRHAGVAGGTGFLRFGRAQS